MTDKTIGGTISFLRKEKGMTQADLAEKMNVTEQAVSKWERNLAYPDITTVPKLAELLGLTADDLLKGRIPTTNFPQKRPFSLIPISVTLAMGICLTVTALLKEIDLYSGLMLCGIGLSSLGLFLLMKEYPSTVRLPTRKKKPTGK